MKRRSEFLSDSILTKQQVAAYIDKCISSLDSNDCIGLTELATLMQTLAIVTDESAFFPMPQSIGSYANELAKFRTLVAIPILGEDERKKCTKCMKEATGEGIKGLELLKKELCDSSKPRSDNILKAVAKFSKHAYLMYSIRTQYTAFPGSPKPQQE